MSSSQFRLYNSQLKHVDAIAQCHEACFPNSLSTKLGIEYIRKTFEWFLVADNRFLFHIEIDNEVVGYCGGFISKGIGDGSSSGMLQYAFKEAVIGIIKKPWLAFNAEVMKVYPFVFKNIKNKVVPQKIKPFSTNENIPIKKNAGLVVIGVHPHHRGTGIFDALMYHFFDESKKYGVTGCKLSVKKDNARGVNAYKKFGWEIDEEHTKTYVFKKVLL